MINPDNYVTNINSEVRSKDIDEIGQDTSTMTDEELDDYIENNIGYIDHPEVR